MPAELEAWWRGFQSADAETRKAMLLPETGPRKRRRRRRKKPPVRLRAGPRSCVTIAYVGIGSNLEIRVRQVRQALTELDRLPHTRVVRKSSLYRSAPMGHADQPDFINAVAQVETGLPAERLLAELQAMEARHGRERSFPNAPRTLDLDMLLYGDCPDRLRGADGPPSAYA